MCVIFMWSGNKAIKCRLFFIASTRWETKHVLNPIKFAILHASVQKIHFTHLSILSVRVPNLSRPWDGYTCFLYFKTLYLACKDLLNCQVVRVTFLMAWHLAISECPIILSGEQILMKGNWESSEILAASAVFPLLGGPEGEDQIKSVGWNNT